MLANCYKGNRYARTVKKARREVNHRRQHRISSSKDQRQSGIPGDRGSSSRKGPAKRTPRRHQAEALRAIADRDYVALLWDMRLGKTLVAIRWAERRPGTVLVIAPLTVGGVWEKELATECIPCCRLMGTSKQKMLAAYGAYGAGIHWFIVNPEAVRADPNLAKNYSTIICDEATWMKNPKSKISKVMRKVKAPRRAILTGLLTPESTDEAFCPMAWIRGGEFMGCNNYYVWRQRYMQAADFGWEINPTKTKEVKNAVAADSLCLTTEQAGQFAKRVEERIESSMTTADRRDYRRMEKKWEGPGEVTTRVSIVAQGWQRQVAAGIPPGIVVGTELDEDGGWTPGGMIRPHSEEIARLVTEELRRDRVVIWYSFTAERLLLEAALDAVGVQGVVRIHGKVKPVDRTARIDAFSTGKARIMLIQLATGRFGVDLSAGTAMIFSSNAWDWETRAQAIRRCDHADKKKPVLVIDVAPPKTIAEDVLEVLKEKKSNAERFRDGVMKRVLARGGRVF